MHTVGMCFEQVYNNTWANGFSQYTFGPGWINFNGGDFPTADTTRLATINGTSLRGSNTVYVNSIVNVTVGTVSAGPCQAASSVKPL